MIFTAAVEGPSDEALLRRLVESLGHRLGNVHGRNGKDSLLRDLKGYNHAARYTPWILLVDLDRGECAVEAKNIWLPEPSQFMCYRIAVRELESWLLADRNGFSEYFGVSLTSIPTNSDALEDPKQALLNVIRTAKRKAIRDDMLPNPRLGQTVGPAYTARVIEYVSNPNAWNPLTAAQASTSLRRAREHNQTLGRGAPVGEV